MGTLDYDQQNPKDMRAKEFSELKWGSQAEKWVGKAAQLAEERMAEIVHNAAMYREGCEGTNELLSGSTDVPQALLDSMILDW